MLSFVSTSEKPRSTAELKSIGKTVYTAAGIAALVSANFTPFKMPSPMDIAASLCIAAKHISDFGHNGNTNVLWDGISVMTCEVLNSFFRLNEIEKLPDNWNGNGAPAFSEDLIALARRLVWSLPIQPVILPTGRDSIQMEYENSRGDYLEFELFEGGRLKMFCYTYDGTAETKDISFAAANKAVYDFYGRSVR